MKNEASPETNRADTPFQPLIDGFGRVHTSLRVSVTDACNIRCRYCMPESVGAFLPQDRLLSFDAIERVVRVLSGGGIRKVRLTGGEPLMRPQLPKLVNKLAALGTLGQIALTTNGMMLSDCMRDLASAGLTHINISLDTLREETFRKLSRREGIDQVLRGISAAMASGLPVRLNALVLRDMNLGEIDELLEFARERGLVLRFIEFMPLDGERAWSQSQVVTGDELRARIETRFGALIPVDGGDPSQPSRDYRFHDGHGGVGFIDPVSKPFCGACNRLRLTADGKFRNCLFGKEEWDVRGLIDAGGTDEDLYALAAASVRAKYASHGISEKGFRPPERAMYQIGG